MIITIKMMPMIEILMITMSMMMRMMMMMEYDDDDDSYVYDGSTCKRQADWTCPH